MVVAVIVLITDVNVKRSEVFSSMIFCLCSHVFFRYDLCHYIVGLVYQREFIRKHGESTYFPK